jgi:uncharacterized membrane protein
VNGAWFRWLVRPPASFGGLVGALLFFWISLTPSLLPRAWLFQGIVSGLSAVIGFGVGSAVAGIGRRMRPGATAPTPALRRRVRIVTVVVAVVGTVVLLWQAQRWQNELRSLMGVGHAATFFELGVVLLAVFVASVGLLVARLVRSFTRFVIRQVDRVAPRAVSVPVGLVLAIVLVAGFVQGVVGRGLVRVLNDASAGANHGTNEGSRRPSSAERSGGPGSLVSWSSLGREGRAFVGEGPTLAELQAFHGPKCCHAPIRAYVGVQSPGSVEDHARLAVRELDRTGAFDRAVVGVFVATGNGWINPKVADALEYLYGGDTAEVSLQYSYLPSAVSFLVDQQKAGDAAKALVDTVLARVATLPPGHRPKVLLYGESLGSYGIERAFGNINALRARVDGALLVGPTFANPIWDHLVAHREHGSPQWLPKLASSAGVYFAGAPADLTGVADAAAQPHVVYLQNASDPVTWWNLRLAYRKPAWAGSPAAPDRAPGFRWFPVVTFLQATADLANSLGVPAGHGHYFGSNVVDGWIAVAKPAQWTANETARLRALVVPLDESPG